ncbi:uncharacterized protein [Palaemon carinicauda]|uniref:uncharacterized protein n=1 Tax=Palaemon carinicauda TaxID=392227 RepID=UPI0035B6299A
MLSKGALQPVQKPSPGFCNRLFLVEKATGGWRPVIDLSALNKFIKKTTFKMDTSKLVLAALREGDFMISLDLKDAYFQIPVHPSSRKFLSEMGVPIPAVQDLLLRPVNSASGVHEGVHPGISLGTQTGHQADQIPQRLVASFSFIGRLEGAGHKTCTVLQGSRDHNQPRKVPVSPNHQDDVPRDGPGLPAGESVSLSGEAKQPRPSDSPVSSRHSNESQGLAETLGTPGLIGKISPSREAQAEASAVKSEGPLGGGGVTAEGSQDDPGLQEHAPWWSNRKNTLKEGKWSLEEKILHINLLELMAVQKAPATFAHLLRGNSVALMCDNARVVAYMKQGGLISRELCALTAQILE